VLLAAVLLVAACSDDDDDAAPATTTTTSTATSTTTTTVAAYEPAFSSVPCDEPVPESDRVACGTLTVPLDRDAPDEGDAVLPVVVIRSAAAAPAPDPVLHITGGPGFAAQVWTAFFLERDLGGDRDVILMDQRGTGEARPSLDCPEIVDAEIANALVSEPPEAEDARVLEAMDRCHTRLVGDGVDLSLFDTIATASDFADLRVALGLDQWNVWGHSYGTVVAQELVRSHPEGIRSVVLDGVLPLDVDTGPVESARLFEDAVATLFRGCRADPACAAAHPDAEAQFRALVDEWQADPFEVDARDHRGDLHTFAVDGRDVVNGAFQALYDSALIPVLPSLAPQLRERGDAARAVVAPLLEQSFIQTIDLSEAQQRAVDCADRSGLLEELPAPPDDPAVALFVAGVQEDVCEAWGLGPSPASFNELASWDLPTLVLSGEYDPVTPPRYARRVVEELGDVVHVELPGLGHGVVFASECAATLLRTFLDGDVDQSCAASLGPPQWAV
jgi:pimeloyl-ACP methyl ester carboxylesterase